MEPLDHTHISGLLELVIEIVALAIIVIVPLHHSHQLKSETTTFVAELITQSLLDWSKLHR